MSTFEAKYACPILLRVFEKVTFESTYKFELTKTYLPRKLYMPASVNSPQ